MAAPFEAVFAHCVFELLHGEIGKLQRQRRERREAVRLLRAQRRQPFVLRLDDFFDEFALLAIPPRVDTEHFHVDALRVHAREALVEVDQELLRALGLRKNALCLIGRQQRERFRESGSAHARRWS